MYTDCLDHRHYNLLCLFVLRLNVPVNNFSVMSGRIYNLHVHVFGNDILEFKYPLSELLICHTNFEKAATEIKEC